MFTVYRTDVIPWEAQLRCTRPELEQLAAIDAAVREGHRLEVLSDRGHSHNLQEFHRPRRRPFVGDLPEAQAA